jgi:hypothetical protein
LGWAAENWADFNGRLLCNNVDWEQLDAEQICDVAYTMIIDDIMELGSSRVEAREVIDKRLKDVVIRDNAQRGVKTEPEPFKLDASTAAQLGIRLPTPAVKKP